LRWILILLMTAACALAQSPLERAVTLTREKRYAEARKELVGVPEPSSTNQRIAFFRLKAAIASGLGEAAQAAAEIESAVALAPGDNGLLLAAALAELHAGHLDIALQHARGAGNTAAAQELTGDILEKHDDYVEAAKAYQSAVTLAPDREEYRIALALEFAQHYTFEPAIDVLRQAAPLFPKSARIRTLLGISQYAVKHVDDAIQALTDAIDLDPSLEPAYAYLARVTLESTATPPQHTLDVMCRWNPEVCSALKLRNARETDDAKLRNEAIEGLKRAPAGSAIARCELGRAYEWSGEWKQARAQMEDCVRLSPSAETHYRLGLIYGQLELPDLARKEMNLRQVAIQRAAQDIARHQDAVRAFQYVLK
jgi:tetratricopeptide (TPR) repeat protein